MDRVIEQGSKCQTPIEEELAVAAKDYGVEKIEITVPLTYSDERVNAASAKL